jgi:hypothetical protein
VKDRGRSGASFAGSFTEETVSSYRVSSRLEPATTFLAARPDTGAVLDLSRVPKSTIWNRDERCNNKMPVRVLSCTCLPRCPSHPTTHNSHFTRLTTRAAGPHKRLPLGGEDDQSPPTQGTFRSRHRQFKCRCTRQSPQGALDQRSNPRRVSKRLPYRKGREGCACRGIFGCQAAVVAR